MECAEVKDGLRGWSQEANLPDAARVHLSLCAGCALLWRRERELTAALSALRRHSDGASASPRVKSAVMAALPAAAPRRDWRPFLALAALLLVSALAGWYFTRRPAAPLKAGAAQPAAVYTDFFPLSSGALIDRHEQAQLVRIRLPRGEMRRFGLPVSEELERSSVEADVLIGQDGIARAVRFVSRNQ